MNLTKTYRSQSRESDSNHRLRVTRNLTPPYAAWSLMAKRATLTTLSPALAALPLQKPLPKRHVVAWAQAAWVSPFDTSLQFVREAPPDTAARPVRGDLNFQDCCE